MLQLHFCCRCSRFELLQRQASNLPSGAGSLVHSTTILRTFDQSRVSLVDPLRGPMLPNSDGTLELGDGQRGGS